MERNAVKIENFIEKKKPPKKYRRTTTETIENIETYGPHPNTSTTSMEN